MVLDSKSDTEERKVNEGSGGMATFGVSE